MTFGIASNAIDSTLRLGEWSIPLAPLDITAIITLIGLIFTIYFSARAIRESRRATTLAFLPIIELKRANLGQHGDRYKLSVRNIGKSYAFNIQLKSWYILRGYSKLTRTPEGLDVMVAHPVDILAPDDEEPLDLDISKIVTIGSSGEILVYELTKEESINKVDIEYSDASGVKYVMRISIMNGDFKIVKPPRRLWLTTHALYLMSRQLGWLEMHALHTIEKMKRKLDEAQ